MAGAGEPQSWTTLKPGATATDRRLYALTTTTSAPASETDGFSTLGNRYLVTTCKLSAGSVTYVTWLYDSTADKWSIDTRPAQDTAGAVTFASTDGNQINFNELIGAPRMAIQVTAISGGGTFEVWGSSVTF